MTSKLESTLAEVQRQVPDCVAVGLVDMTSGMLLGVRTTDQHPPAVLELVAAATADLFRGPNVTAIEQSFRRARGVPEDGKGYFEEITVTSAHLLHVFIRGKRNPNHVLVAVTKLSANLGMVKAKTSIALAAVEAAV